MYSFNAHDVLQFAIRIEENGEAFYREAAKTVLDQAVTGLFARLADEEVNHRKTFEGLLSALGDYRPPETYEGEYLVYLKDFIDGRAIFKDHPKITELAKMRDAASALDFAIQRELDSILYYEEMRRYVGPQSAGVIDRIVDEERKHFAMLSQIRKNYS